MSDRSCNSKNCYMGECSEPHSYGSCSVSLQNCPMGEECNKESERCLSVEEKIDALNCRNSAHCPHDRYCKSDVRMCFWKVGKEDICLGPESCKDGLTCVGSLSGLPRCLSRCITDSDCLKGEECVKQYLDVNYCKATDKPSTITPTYTPPKKDPKPVPVSAPEKPKYKTKKPKYKPAKTPATTPATPSYTPPDHSPYLRDSNDSNNRTYKIAGALAFLVVAAIVAFFVWRKCCRSKPVQPPPPYHIQPSPPVAYAAPQSGAYYAQSPQPAYQYDLPPTK